MEKISRELLIEIDIQGRIKSVSANSKNILGYLAEEMVGKILWSFSQEKGALNNKRKLMEINTTMEFVSKACELLCFDVEIDTCDDSIYLSMIKIKESSSDKKTMDYFNSMMENSKDIIYRLQIRPEIKFTYINDTVSQITGIDIEEIKNNPMSYMKIFHPQDRPKIDAKLCGELDYMKPLIFRIMDKNGDYMWFEDKIHPIYDGNQLVALEGICRDVHERKELEQKLEIISEYDCLTGLKNRRSFEREISILNAVDTKVGIIVFDLDNLKVVNDTLGHFEGDNLLRDFSNLLSSYFGYFPSIFRIGGDEFVVILKDMTEKKAMEIFYGFEDVIKNHNERYDSKLQTSKGICYSKKSRGIIREIFKKADDKMYKDKKSRKHSNCKKKETVENRIDGEAEGTKKNKYPRRKMLTAQPI